jgi:hypothetical protein
MTLRQITFDDVDNPCVQCKQLDMDDQVPDKCPVWLVLKEAVGGVE